MGYYDNFDLLRLQCGDLEQPVATQMTRATDFCMQLVAGLLRERDLDEQAIDRVQKVILDGNASEAPTRGAEISRVEIKPSSTVVPGLHVFDIDISKKTGTATPDESYVAFPGHFMDRVSRKGLSLAAEGHLVNRVRVFAQTAAKGIDLAGQ